MQSTIKRGVRASALGALALCALARGIVARGALICGVLAFGVPVSAHAAGATPSAVLQRAMLISEQVARLLEADFADPSISEHETVAARPRHVYQFALKTSDAVQMLRRLNGHAVRPTPPTPPRDVTPAEVLALLETVIDDLAGLGEAYSVTLPTALPGAREAITPAEVMARLRGNLDAFERLGLPPTLPNDVYRNALALREVMGEVARLKGAGKRANVVKVMVATPTEAMAELAGLSQDLAELIARHPDIAPPGGAFAPPAPPQDRPVRPADVLTAANFVLADAWAVAVRAGVTTALEMPPEQSGRTPADVRNTLAEARAIVRQISALPSSGTAASATTGN